MGLAGVRTALRGYVPRHVATDRVAVRADRGAGSRSYTTREATTPGSGWHSVVADRVK